MASEEKAQPLAEAEYQDVEESDELCGIVRKVADSLGTEARALFPRYKQILDFYQEQSQLLDPYISQLVTPLTTLLRTWADAHSGAVANDDAARGGAADIHHVARYLQLLVVVRGHKTIVRFFPNDAACLEPIFALLQRMQQDEMSACGGDSDEGSGTEAQCVLLLWLSMLALIPFNLSTVDSSAGAHSTTEQSALVRSMMAACKAQLHESSAVREMAALLLARLLTRADMNAALGEFLTWGVEALRSATEPRAAFFIPGVLLCMAMVFKFGQRSMLESPARMLWPHACAMPADPRCASNVLPRKLAMKLVQRLCLTFLPPKLAAWRYQIGRTVLGASFANTQPSAATAAVQDGSAVARNNDDADDDELLSEEAMEVVAEAIDCILTGLHDKDTIVRWSAAKGIGRIAARLPADMAADIIASLPSSFDDVSADAAWHGGCLALAELARRGVLLPSSLADVVPYVVKALQYDVRRGPHSIGAHVRDAAAYVCWAFARAYSPDALQASVYALSPAMLTTACYDREVHCRRAAAAAFQECVGRLGNFPNGIDIVTAADYFTLSTRSNAYLQVAPYVATFDAYWDALVRHLLHDKLRHWEKLTRELAARALARLASVNADWLATHGIDTLLPLCTHEQLEVRHGAVCGVAELVLQLHNTAHGSAGGIALSEERQQQVANIVINIERARLYRGKGGEILRGATCRLIECQSIAQLPLSKTQVTKLHDSLDDNLRHPNADIQRAAATALAAFCRSYLQQASEAAIERTVHKYRRQLHDANVAVRRGYAAALGALPHWLLRPCYADVLCALCGATEVEEDAEERDADSRVNAASAIACICDELARGVADDDAAAIDLCSFIAAEVLPALLKAMDDYSIDNRGDVGSWVRDAAMAALRRCMLLVLRHAAAIALLPALCTQVAAAMLKQMVERIARVREAAATNLKLLLQCDAYAHCVPAAAAMKLVIVTDDSPVCFAKLSSLERVVPFIVVPEYGEPLMEGLVASIGGLDNALSRAALASLTAVVNGRHREEGPVVETHNDVLLLGPMTAEMAAAVAAGTQGPGAPPDTMSYSPYAPAAIFDAASAAQRVAWPAEVSQRTLTRQRVADLMLAVWNRHARSGRMATPLLKTLDLLFSITGVHELAGDSEVASALLERVRGEGRQCRDVARLMCVAAALCQLILLGPPATHDALQAVLTLMVNKFPRVRKAAAEQLYITLLSLQDSDPSHATHAAFSNDALEQASSVLLQSVWDGDAALARDARNTVAQLLSVSLPTAVAPAGEKKPSARQLDVENQSYQSLVDDFARGY